MKSEKVGIQKKQEIKNIQEIKKQENIKKKVGNWNKNYEIRKCRKSEKVGNLKKKNFWGVSRGRSMAVGVSDR